MTSEVTTSSLVEEPFDPAAVRPIVFGVLVGISLAAVSQTFVTTALPTIVGELGGYGALSWVVSVYLLTSGIVVPFAGKLADRFGAALMFRLSIAVFALGSALAALSTSMTMLVVARGVQGMGGGGLMTVAFTLIARLVPPRERGRYQSRVASLFAVTSVTGPLVGGFFVDHLSWRLAFVTVTLLGLVALVVVRRLPADEGVAGDGADVVGGALLVVGLMSLMLSTVWGGQRYSWTSPVIVALLAVALVFSVVFVVWERSAGNPIVPVRLMHRRTVWVAVTLGALSSVSMFAVIVLAPSYLQVSLGVNATTSGLLLVPLMGCTLIGSTTAGRVMSRTARYRRVAIAGALMLVAGSGLLTTLSETTAIGVPSIYVGLVGLGIGLLMPVTLVAVQNQVASQQLGAATSLTQFTRKIGSTVGVAALGGLFTAQVTRSLDGASIELPDGVSPGSLLETPSAIEALPTELADAVRVAIADGMSVSFVLALVAAVVGLGLALFLPDAELAASLRSSERSAGT